MELFPIDQNGQLFISPDIDDWQPIIDNSIDVIFDLDGDSDAGVPYLPNQIFYVYFSFEDRDLPNLEKLHSLARLGASLIKSGHRVLAHCGMGHNRSALVAGLILMYLGMSGIDAVTLLRQKRQGALYNKVFASYLQNLSLVSETYWESNTSPIAA
ncbi:dual specificity protein phosphatase family protein [Phormidium sp. LEGE 05292]|uniref:protein-tyrosine phosphatase family protein n=1 Tax=[Phormidium] sp. LEGE 05292 TaxID=767427 RepID=UPI001882AEF7|nr:dual specificity protein phosphatase family protein [Phormidium sp. LEGE 05292]MBE9228690.1 dual specificity protein phosphatase family protein [Phormidium sp. LEGE 05292]